MKANEIIALIIGAALGYYLVYQTIRANPAGAIGGALGASI